MLFIYQWEMLHKFRMLLIKDHRRKWWDQKKFLVDPTLWPCRPQWTFNWGASTNPKISQQKNATQSSCALSSSIRSKRKSANFHFLRNMAKNVHQSGPFLWAAACYIKKYIGITRLSSWFFMCWTCKCLHFRHVPRFFFNFLPSIFRSAQAINAAL